MQQGKQLLQAEHLPVRAIQVGQQQQKKLQLQLQAKQQQRQQQWQQRARWHFRRQLSKISAGQERASDKKPIVF